MGETASISLINKIEILPPDLRLALESYLDFLIQKLKAAPAFPSRNGEAVFCRKAGSLKGSILFMADDFDAPLEDFKDYM